MTSFTELERRAQCPHGSLSKEVICGQKTGDSICNDCGDTFMPNEEAIPVEYRDSMIISTHALMVALRVNNSLKLIRNFKAKWGDEYHWALVNEVNGFSLPVLGEVATSALSSGFVKL